MKKIQQQNNFGSHGDRVSDSVAKKYMKACKTKDKKLSYSIWIENKGEKQVRQIVVKVVLLLGSVKEKKAPVSSNLVILYTVASVTTLGMEYAFHILTKMSQHM